MFFLYPARPSIPATNRIRRRQTNRVFSPNRTSCEQTFPKKSTAHFTFNRHVSHSGGSPKPSVELRQKKGNSEYRSIFSHPAGIRSEPGRISLPETDFSRIKIGANRLFSPPQTPESALNDRKIIRAEKVMNTSDYKNIDTL